MKPAPTGWPRISTALYYDDASKAIDWLCKAFGFQIRLKVEGENGSIEHSELELGDGLIMVGEAHRTEKCPYRRSPTAIGGANTQNMMVYVDDVEAHCKRAREAGATITMEPKVSDYGEEYWTDRGYECSDIGGHHWWFQERMRTGTPKKA
ncbi:glyoxalase/bleomycin resistance/extradiol dioxygenase family protein [soil metagenome]